MSQREKFETSRLRTGLWPVMYLGRIVEIAEAATLYRRPLHPYTSFLMAAIPIPNPRVEAARPHLAPGNEMPSPIDLPSGCSFRPRCRYATEECASVTPVLTEVEPGHFAACARAQAAIGDRGNMGEKT